MEEAIIKNIVSTSSLGYDIDLIQLDLNSQVFPEFFKMKSEHFPGI